MRVSFILQSLVFGLVGLIPVHSQAKSPKPNLVITSVQADETTLFIKGTGFKAGSSLVAKIDLNPLDGKLYETKLQILSNSDKEIVAPIPIGGIPPGSYSLKIKTTDPRQTATFDFTIGAVGPQGIPGQDGQDGADGKDGTNGTNGIDGQDGTNGTNGVDGKDGTNGTNGIDGQDGTNGTDGIDGQDGTNGTNGIDGQDGADGLNALVEQVELAPGEGGCENGGILVQTGHEDPNGPPGTFLGEPSTGTVCNGTDGQDGGGGLNASIIRVVARATDPGQSQQTDFTGGIHDGPHTVTATCPQGTILAGGGYSVSDGVQVFASGPSSTQAPGIFEPTQFWKIEIETTGNASVNVSANCILLDSN